jgi:transcriptional regulator with XRE-family HTH domain
MKARIPAPQTARIRLAANLRAARAKLGISQEELADRAGINRTFVGSVERRERNISLDNIERLAVALGMDVTELLKKD